MQVSCPKLELGQWIGTQTLDGFRRRRGLMLQPGLNGRFEISLLAGWQRPELPLGVLRDGDFERHGLRLGSPFVFSITVKKSWLMLVMPCRKVMLAGRMASG